MEEYRHSRSWLNIAWCTKALHEKNEDWEICQLAVTCNSDEDCEKYIVDMAESLVRNEFVIPRETIGGHRSLWGMSRTW